MIWERTQTLLNPLVAKTVVGILAAGLLVLALFHQPWIPIEISRPETGVLAAMPASARSVPFSLPSHSSAKPETRQEEPIDVPFVTSADETLDAEAPPFVQTAEATPTATDAPSPEWQLGRPTVAYQLPEAFLIPVSETGLRWSFVIPTGVERALYLTGAELRPGNKSLVKRMILSYDASGTARRKDQETPAPGFPASDSARPQPAVILAEWSPGRPAQFAPQGKAHRIPAGADLVLTVDYAATAVSAADPWSMGLHLVRPALR